MGKNKYVDLFNDMIPAVDEGIKELWDAAGDDGRKEIKGDLWNLTRYISSVGTNRGRGKAPTREQQEHYVLAVNEYYNKNWNELQKNHPKLLWMLLCLCSYDKKTRFFHEWIPLSKAPVDKKTKLLSELYPNMKMDELEVLSKVSSDKEIKQLLKEHGWEDSAIAKRLK